MEPANVNGERRAYQQQQQKPKKKKKKVVVKTKADGKHISIVRRWARGN